MYSRYSGISIPSNYGGSRFRQESEPEVKAHRPPTLTASKVARSPSFIPIESRERESSEPPIEEQSKETVIDSDEFYDDTNEGACDDTESEANADECEKAISHYEKSDQGLSKIKAVISRFDKDALIILGLILLLMSDSEKENDDIIALLALLLLG